MKFEQIKELIKILEGSSLNEINYKEGENKIELKKSPTFEYVPNQLIPSNQPHTQTDANSANLKNKEEHKDQTAEVKDKKTKEDLNMFYVESPLVGTFYQSSSPGTFYQSSSPDAEHFVKIGSKVKKGDPLCIIEAMKIMNVIESEVNGTIEEIYIENAHFVEYKSRIFRIKKA